MLVNAGETALNFELMVVKFVSLPINLSYRHLMSSSVSENSIIFTGY